ARPVPGRIRSRRDAGPVDGTNSACRRAYRHCEAHNEQVIIDGAVYRDGLREDTSDDPATLDATLASLSGSDFLWIGLSDPSREQVERFGAALGLHPLAV